MAKYQTRLADRREIAEGTVAVLLEKPEGFDYEAGQYVTLELPDIEEAPNGGGSHAFTLASAPYEDRLMIATRMRDSGYKRTLSQISVGASVNLQGPSGTLTLPKDGGGRPLVFLAGGIGITPFRSMVRQMIHEKQPYQVTLIYSNHRPEDAAFLNELKQLDKEAGNYRIVNTMTKMEDSAHKWDGETGRVDPEMLKRHVKNLDEPIYYVAGPPDMVDSIQGMLRNTGIQEDRIHAEEFSGY